ncbi:putative ribonuclease H-like domain-containing protein [Tanacetum coccineum]
MDVKSAFLYGKIDEEVYVSQPPGFQDPQSPQKVYKVVKALYGLHQAPRVKFDFANVKSASTPIKLRKPLVKDEEASFKSLPKTSHLKPSQKRSLGSDSDYARANLLTGKSQPKVVNFFLWQNDSLHGNAKSKPIVATSTTEIRNVAAASCCGQSLWIQIQMLDYGFKFHETQESTLIMKAQMHWKRISYKRTKNQAKNDKIEHGMEKHGKAKVKPKSKSKSTRKKSTVKTGADTEEYLMGFNPTHLMGRDKP